jgi:hypothetical protein
MIAFEVRINGKKICVAGARDLSVLDAAVAAVGTLGPRTKPSRPDGATNELYLHVGGLTRRADKSRDVHLKWTNLFRELSVGDVVAIKVVEVAKADRPRSRTPYPAKRRRD